MSLKFLLVEDDELTRLAIKELLSSHGFVINACDNAESKRRLESEKIDILFVDLDLVKPLDGLELIHIAKQFNIYTVVISGRDDNETIEQAYRLGCHDYLCKPIGRDGLVTAIKKFNLIHSKEEWKKTFFSEKFLTADPDQIQALSQLPEWALDQLPILIQGPTGVGKTKLAREIHNLGGLSEHRPFININCSEFAENLLESELFGHVKGAFSGAVNSKKGKLELANGGTLFLDEIGTMPFSLQQKLLKALEEGTFYPVGSEKMVSSNFRIISATCDELQGAIAKGKFRLDLFYRIMGHNLILKDLSKRPLDIPLLISAKLRAMPRKIIIDSFALEALCSYSWPGNVRELEKVMSVLASKQKGIITVNDLPYEIVQNNSFEGQNDNIDKIFKLGLNSYIETIEEQIVLRVFKENGHKVRKTIQDLKISSNSFYRILNRIRPQLNETSL